MRPPPRGPTAPGRAPAASVARLVDQLVLGDPGHHAAQLATDLLDRVLGAHAAHGLEAGLAGLALGDPVAGEAAGLDVGEDALHLLLGLVGDDARAAGVVAVLGGVRDRVAHVGDAAFVDEVDDQLHLVQAFEIGHLRRVAGLNQRLVAGLDQRREATAEHDLLAEQVGLALLLEAGLDDSGAAAADGAGVGERDLQGVAAGVLLHGHQARHAAAADVFG